MDTTSVVQKLLDDLRGGDRAAADQLVQIAYKRVKTAVGRILRVRFPDLEGVVDRTDVLHDVAIKLRKYIGDEVARVPENPREFFGLVNVITRRTCVDLVRHFKINPLVPAGGLTGGLPAAAPETLTEDREAVLGAVEQLDPEDRELYYALAEGDTLADIGERLGGLKPSTISERKTRMLGRVRERLVAAGVLEK